MTDARISQTDTVLHVLAPGHHGGVENVVAMLAGYQPAHVVAVLDPGDAPANPFIARLKSRGIAVTPVIVGRRSYLQEFRMLRELIRKLEPQIVHTHGYHADIIAAAAARAEHVSSVSTVHGFLGVPLRNKVYEQLQLLALRKAEAVIAVSRPLAERVAQSGVHRDRIHTIPNGFFPAARAETRDAARRVLGLSEQSRVVGWVGRLSREKGADVALEALAKCREPWLLSIIGNGQERAALQAQASALGITERVTWHGALEGAGTLLKAFDAFVLSSRTEGTPIALLEAMYAGIPIVATRVGGVPDVVGDSEAFLVNSEDAAAIASNLDGIARSPESANVRASLAQKRVISRFDASRWMQAIQTVYDSVTAKVRRTIH